MSFVCWPRHAILSLPCFVFHRADLIWEILKMLPTRTLPTFKQTQTVSCHNPKFIGFLAFLFAFCWVPSTHLHIYLAPIYLCTAFLTMHNVNLVLLFLYNFLPRYQPSSQDFFLVAYVSFLFARFYLSVFEQSLSNLFSFYLNTQSFLISSLHNFLYTAKQLKPLPLLLDNHRLL